MTSNTNFGPAMRKSKEVTHLDILEAWTPRYNVHFEPLLVKSFAVRVWLSQVESWVPVTSNTNFGPTMRKLQEVTHLDI